MTPLKYLALGLAALSLSACATVDAEGKPLPVKIVRDEGGSAMKYDMRAQRWMREGRAVVIDGTCSSACLIFLHEWYGLDVCATPKAKLGFHAGYQVDPRTNQIDRSPRAREGSRAVTEAIISGLPPVLREAYDYDQLPSVYKGDSAGKMKWITGAEAQAAIGACK